MGCYRVVTMFCMKCQYSLQHLESRTCPECGRPFDPADEATFYVKLPRYWRWELIPAVVCLIAAVAWNPFRINWIYFESYFCPPIVCIALAVGCSVSASRRGGVCSRLFGGLLFIASSLYLLHLLATLLWLF